MIKYDTIYIVTTIIGLIGGVVTILQLVIPFIVRFVRRRRQNRISVASKENELEKQKDKSRS